MLKKFQKTLSIGLSGLLVLGVGVGTAYADTAARRAPNVLHEMVPHVVLPETIQYNKTVKSLPGNGYTGVTSPNVGTYVAYPSYQVPHTAAFRPIGQSVYPVSPQVPPPLPRMQPQAAPEPDTSAIEEVFAGQASQERDVRGRDVVLSPNISEPIRLASGAEELIPILPSPNSVVVQTGIFCQQPAKPPSAWAFSSPIFKVASVPASWVNGQSGSITHHSPRGSGQHIGFMPAGNIDPAMAGAAPQGIPYSTFQMGRGVGQESGTQVQILPNGMLLLTLPPTHHNCGLLRCRASCVPRTMLLPPAGHFQQAPQMMMPQGMMPPAMMPQMAPAPDMQNAMMMPGAMMPNGMMPHGMMSHGMPFMQVAQQHPQMMMPPQMMPQMQMQMVPVTAMTPMGPAVVGFQQVPMMNPMMHQMAMNQMAMNPMGMMNPMMNSQIPPQIQMVSATPEPMVASQVSGTGADEGMLQPPALMGGMPGGEHQMGVVATPFGYAIQVPADALQGDVAAQLAQMQQALMQSQMQSQMQTPMPQMAMPMQMQMPMNPYAGLYATPFGYVAMNQSAGQFGGFGQPSMFMPAQMNQGGMSITDMLQLMALINSNNKPRRARLFERVADRRAARRAGGHDDPFAMLMQAWTTPYASPDTTLRMPARNAYPYGYFGVQTPPISTANHGGFHNLYFGNTTYPGLY